MDQGGNNWTLFTPGIGKFCTLFYKKPRGRDLGARAQRAGLIMPNDFTLERARRFF